MGNEQSTTTDRARKAVGDITSSFTKSVKKLDTGAGSSDLLDNLCGPYFDERSVRANRSYASAYSSEDDSRTAFSEADTMDESLYHHKKKGGGGSESESTDYERRLDAESMDESHDDSWNQHHHPKKSLEMKTPLASSFAKRCYFTKAGIGKTTQHYEGLTLTGNIVLMLASAMKLKGCPTICDEDLRRVEQTYPNQFSRLPDELLLSSGWRRISKYCHFSNKPIPDGIPFFHSRQRIHPSGGYYFLLAAAVGMVRPCDVYPLTRDTLVLLETDYPTQCDAAPRQLIDDASLWTLVDKFCFFSGGPINSEDDVYYQADFDGNPIYMLAFLSPSLTPEELYKLDENKSEPGILSMMEVEQVEQVYDLTERDFEDLKLYHLGPCRALPQYLLQPGAWTKVLPPHFLMAKENAMIRAHEYELAHAPVPSQEGQILTAEQQQQHQQQHEAYSSDAAYTEAQLDAAYGRVDATQMQPAEFSYQEPPQQQYTGHPEQQVHVQTEAVPQHNAYAPHLQQRVQQQQQQQGQPPLDANNNAFAYQEQELNQQQFAPIYPDSKNNSSFAHDSMQDSITHEQNNFQREMEEEGAFVSSGPDAPIDEAMAQRTTTTRYPVRALSPRLPDAPQSKLDPPEDEPPSLSRRSYDEEEPSYDYEDGAKGDGYYREEEYYDSPSKQDASGYHEGDSYYEKSYYGGDGGNHFDASHATEKKSAEDPSMGYYNIPPTESPVSKPYEDESTQKDYYEEQALPPQPAEYYEEQAPPAEQYYPEEAPPPQDYYHEEQEPVEQYYPEGNDDEYYNVTDETYSKQPQEEPYYDEPSEKQEYYDAPESSAKQEYYEESAVDKDSYSAQGPPSPREPSAAAAESFEDSAPSKPVTTSPSSAMRGAHELLKRNRQKRYEAVRKKQSPPRKEEVAPASSTWDNRSELTSVVSGSSVWTDDNSNQDRSSRRALILQMAKARMKSNKAKDSSIVEEDQQSHDISFTADLD